MSSTHVQHKENMIKHLKKFISAPSWTHFGELQNIFFKATVHTHFRLYMALDSGLWTPGLVFWKLTEGQNFTQKHHCNDLTSRTLQIWTGIWWVPSKTYVSTVSKSHISLLIPPSSLAGVSWRNAALRLQQGFHEKAIKFNGAELYLWTGCTVRKNERLVLTHRVNFMNIWWFGVFGVTAQAVIVVIADLITIPCSVDHVLNYWFV